MVFAANYPLLDVLTMLIVFCWVGWIWPPILIFADQLFGSGVSIRQALDQLKAKALAGPRA